VPAHCFPGFFRQAGGDRVRDRLVLFLDLAEIFTKAIGTAFERANALARNNQPAEEFEKLGEAIVLGSQRDRLMKGKIFLDAALASA
jgi:hypothetical protein